MYCKFFGLEQSPFNNTPDPKFFFATPQHEEALACLRYAAEERKGFVLVTGEVGSGKTLLGRLVLQQLGSRARSAMIASSALSPHELMATLCYELDVALDPNANKTQSIQALQDYLLDKYGKDRLVVVLLDEAQNLPEDSFEELRMLGNLEADDAKLLQVLILAQPEILEVLRKPEMKQLRQRIVRTVHLSELSREETAQYIAHRLKVAGGEGKVHFTDEAVALVHYFSGGIPRLINQICDQCLLTAYAQSVRTIDSDIAEEVAEGLTDLDAERDHAMTSAAEAPHPAHAPDETVQDAPEHPAAQRSRQQVDQVLQEEIRQARRYREEMCQTLSGELKYRMQRMRETVDDLRRDAERTFDKTSQRGEELQRSLRSGMEEQVSRIQRTIEQLSKDADTIVDSASRRGEALHKSLAETLEGRLGQIQRNLQGLRQDADDIAAETNQRGEALRESLAGEVETKLDEIQSALRKLNADADRLTENLNERGEVIKESLSKELEAKIDEVQTTIQTLNQDADRITEKARQRGQELRSTLSEDLEGRIDSVEQLIQKLKGETESITVEATRQGEALRERFGAEVQQRLREVETILTELAGGLDTVLDEARSRGDAIRQGLSEDLSGRLARVEVVLGDLTTSADAIIEKTTERSEKLRKSLEEDVEGRVAKLEESVAGIRQDADGIIRQSSEKAAELRELCGVMRKVAGSLSQEYERAEKHRDALHEKNEEARELMPVVEGARQTISLLNQAHKHADKHSGRLAQLVEQAQGLMRDMPEMVNQLQAAATEGRMISTKLDAQMKSIDERITAAEQRIAERIRAMEQKPEDLLKAFEQQAQQRMNTLGEKVQAQLQAMAQAGEVGQKQLAACRSQIEQLDGLLGQAGSVLSALNAVGRAAGITAAPASFSQGLGGMPSPPDVPAEAQQGNQSEAERLIASLRRRATGSQTNPPRPAQQQPNQARNATEAPSANTGEDVSPLIEFDARRAAAAHRAATSKGRVIKGDSQEAETYQAQGA